LRGSGNRVSLAKHRCGAHETGFLEQNIVAGFRKPGFLSKTSLRSSRNPVSWAKHRYGVQETRFLEQNIATGFRKLSYWKKILLPAHATI